MRQLIVNADDLGASPSVNSGIARAHERGIVTSASMMVLAPAATAAFRWASRCETLSVGLHLDLAEWEFASGEWRSRYERVDAADADAVRTEVDRQLGAFLRLAGHPPTHLDSHQHVHREEPVGTILAEVGERLGITVRSQTPQTGPPVVTYRGDYYGQSAKGEPYWQALTLSALLAVLVDLPEGITELGCHPGYADDLNSTYRIEREMETRVLCEPELVSCLQREGIRLVPHGLPRCAAS